VDEGVARRAAVHLLAELADEDVDGSIAVRRAPPPHALEQLVAREHAPLLPRERVEQAELGRRQLGALAVDVRLHVVRIEPQLLDEDRVAAAGLCFADPPASRGANTRGELLHRERLHEVVVGSDLESVYAVVLRSPGGYDDDRGADPLVSGLLDHAPSVDAGEHQVENADIGSFVAQARETGLAVRHADGVESRRLQVARHPAGDDVVVFDDQDFCHSATP